MGTVVRIRDHYWNTNYIWRYCWGMFYLVYFSVISKFQQLSYITFIITESGEVRKGGEV